MDYDKDIHFFDPTELNEPAPIVLDSSANFRKFKHDLDMQDLRNRVYVRGGTYLSDTQPPIEWKADGVARQWTLPWGPHDLAFTVGSTSVTVGIDNVHDEDDYDYMLNFMEKIYPLLIWYSYTSQRHDHEPDS